MNLIGMGRKKSWLTALFLCVVLGLGMLLGLLSQSMASEDRRFEAYVNQLFQKEVSGSTLNLHYTLAKPEKLGITRNEPSLGLFEAGGKDVQEACEEIEKKLASFSEKKLNEENQITRDQLLLSVHTRKHLSDTPYLEEPLSPSLGIQAQLPILLAEYAFYEKEDLVDYLKLLKTVKPYFESILTFEQEKAAMGLFMSDTSLDRVLDQCHAFIRDPDSNYMQDIFEEKIREMDCFSTEEMEELSKAHVLLLRREVIPAYEALIDGLDKLRGCGGESRGLASKEGGIRYYKALLQDETGCYWSLQRIEERLPSQMNRDLREISEIFTNKPELGELLIKGYEMQSLPPEEALEYLREKMEKDFPLLSDAPSYEVRYVHPSMEQFLSPAFYLTPPLDTRSPNVIYINPASRGNGLISFMTLAHEGFPGHLYQTLFFASQNPQPVRSIFASGGYVEGWATYVESVAAGYGTDLIQASDAEDIARLEWLNRSLNLCMYSVLDLGIHAHNWDTLRVSEYLRAFGIEDQAVVGEIYQYIVENPANYLKYYLGYLNFLDLREAEMARLGSDFDSRVFHERVLELGPVAFPVLRKFGTFRRYFG